MDDLKVGDLATNVSDALRAAARRWGDEIPFGILEDVAAVCLAIATERLEDAERLLDTIGERIAEA